ncbi:MAG: hypothetical protein PUD60_06035 [Akkermansia muciniphila]|nr:hypothetical protein [Akkermansia muciniphila]MDD6813941.1 hypothetical protein [Akkermansia muciniphila]
MLQEGCAFPHRRYFARVHASAQALPLAYSEKNAGFPFPLFCFFVLASSGDCGKMAGK